MPLIWEKIPTAVVTDVSGGRPHPCNALYRIKVPGGWLLRDETPSPIGEKSPPVPASGHTLFIPDPAHEWLQTAEEAQRELVGATR